MSTAELTPPPEGEPIHLTQELVDDVESAFTIPDRLIQTQADYEQACAGYLKHQTPRRLRILNDAAQAHVNSFGESFKELAYQTTLFEIMQLANNMLVQDDTQRVAFLNTLCNEEVTVSNPPQESCPTVTDVIDSMDEDEQAETIQTIRTALFQSHAGNIRYDTERFVSFVDEQAKKHRFHMTTEKWQLAQKTSIDVGKIAAGTALGLIIARRFFR